MGAVPATSTDPIRRGPRAPGAGEPMAWVGGRLATDLVELTDDWSRLDSGGWWAVVADFDGPARLARFAQVAEAPLPPAPWQGPPRARPSRSP